MNTPWSRYEVNMRWRGAAGGCLQLLTYRSCLRALTRFMSLDHHLHFYDQAVNILDLSRNGSLQVFSGSERAVHRCAIESIITPESRGTTSLFLLNILTNLPHCLVRLSSGLREELPLKLKLSNHGLRLDNVTGRYMRDTLPVQLDHA